MFFFRLNHKITNKYVLPLLVAITVAVVLFFGLRPKEWTRINNIHWLAEQKALEFTSQSIAYVDDLHSFGDIKNPNEFTLQLSVVPANIGKNGFRPMLMIHDGSDRDQLTLWQWGDSVIVMNGNDYDYSKRWPRISWKEALVAGEESLLTITTGDMGTRLFVNGALVAEKQHLQLTIPRSDNKTRLTLGNSVYGNHNWEGKVYGLGMTGRALSPERVGDYYEKWVTKRDLVIDSIDDPLFLYTFSEYEDGVMLDETGRNQLLQLPQRIIVLKKTLLSGPTLEFRPNLSFFVDVVLNIIGFIPVGAVMYYWSLKSGTLAGRYEVLSIVACCFFFSLSIEVAQVWLPHRHSSFLDLVFNTLGAWMGVMLLEKNIKISAIKSNLNNKK